jgi:hypothetical protein
MIIFFMNFSLKKEKEIKDLLWNIFDFNYFDVYGKEF